MLNAFADEATIERLIEAVRNADLVAVRSMLSARPELANMTVSYADEHRAIHYAVMHRNPEILRLLMQSGADAHAGIYPHRDATSALTLAGEREFDDIVAIIREEERRREEGGPRAAEETMVAGANDTVREAVAKGDIAFLRDLDDEGKLVNQVRWDTGGLLTVAVRSDRMDVLRFLLDRGFDPNERVASGGSNWTAYSQGYLLWHCAALGRREMAQLLLDAVRILICM